MNKGEGKKMVRLRENEKKNESLRMKKKNLQRNRN